MSFPGVCRGLVFNLFGMIVDQTFRGVGAVIFTPSSGRSTTWGSAGNTAAAELQRRSFALPKRPCKWRTSLLPLWRHLWLWDFLGFRALPDRKLQIAVGIPGPHKLQNNFMPDKVSMMSVCLHSRNFYCFFCSAVALPTKVPRDGAARRFWWRAGCTASGSSSTVTGRMVKKRAPRPVEVSHFGALAFVDTGTSGQHARPCTVTVKGEITRCIWGPCIPPWVRCAVSSGTLSLLRMGAEISPFSRYCWVVAVVAY